ncbi:MAG: LytTR family transcriptional regulator DNA-binding domain-containing protein [Bacteroidaceae bacterium]|nr:LytTR family transcriptional regulator DNA-binding domain-containing protein [Bacteroidaceae bacterium]
MNEVIFNKRNELLRVPVTKAVFYEAYGNYCYGVFPNKQKVMLPVGLSQVEQLLASYADANQPKYIRIGKRFIVNTSMIVQVNMTKQVLVLSDFDHPGNFALPISKDALKQIKELYTSKQIWK